MILDEGWRSPVSVDDAGSDADRSFATRWPATVGETEYNEFFNSIVSGASKVGLNPIDDSAASIQLRSLWWNRFSAPPPCTRWIARAHGAGAEAVQPAFRGLFAQQRALQSRRGLDNGSCSARPPRLRRTSPPVRVWARRRAGSRAREGI